MAMSFESNLTKLISECKSECFLDNCVIKIEKGEN